MADPAEYGQQGDDWEDVPDTLPEGAEPQYEPEPQYDPAPQYAQPRYVPRPRARAPRALSPIQQKLAVIRYYELALETPTFDDPNDPIACKVAAEVETFLQSRIAELMGEGKLRSAVSVGIPCGHVDHMSEIPGNDVPLPSRILKPDQFR